MPIPPKSNREKFNVKAILPQGEPLPPIPKLPAEFRRRWPEMKSYFDNYDAQWEEFFKKQSTQER